MFLIRRRKYDRAIILEILKTQAKLRIAELETLLMPVTEQLKALHEEIYAQYNPRLDT